VSSTCPATPAAAVIRASGQLANLRDVMEGILHTDSVAAPPAAGDNQGIDELPRVDHRRCMVASPSWPMALVEAY
jgi:hypothetical protein